MKDVLDGSATLPASTIKKELVMYMDEKTFEFHYLPDRMKYINSSAVYVVVSSFPELSYDELVDKVVEYGIARFYDDLGDREYDKLERHQMGHLGGLMYLRTAYLVNQELYSRLKEEKDNG